MKQLFRSFLVISFGVSLMVAKNTLPVQIELHSYQQVVVKDKHGKVKKDKQGKPVKKWVAVRTAVPGTFIKYVDTVINDSNETLTDVKVKNRIDPNLAFVADSAVSKNKFGTKYSIDGGKHFDVAEKLYVVENKRKRLAKPSEYNALLFTIEKVAPHSSVDISYMTKVK